jgi:hypothetical protein
MSRSKILTALDNFKSEYGWDKSLLNDLAAPLSPSPDLREAHSNTALEDFINGKARDISG